MQKIHTAGGPPLCRIISELNNLQKTINVLQVLFHSIHLILQSVQQSLLEVTMIHEFNPS